MKVLIVDDSVVYRTAITQALSNVPDVEVFKAVSNGKIALDIIKQNHGIDLMILDMEMPIMNGLETIRELRKFNKSINVIIFSAVSNEAAEQSIAALNEGADDFVTKIVGNGSIEQSIEMIRDELLPKIKVLRPRPALKSISVATEATLKTVLASFVTRPKLICIGCSTGGPDALAQVFSQITNKLNIPILLVQHMPAFFTEKLAASLSKLSPVQVKEAKHGDQLISGQCLIAPGDYHMLLKKNLSNEYRIDLNQGEKVCFVRPSVDVLLKTVAENFDGKILSIILTGMGEDGAASSKLLKKRNEYLVIQDKESSIVWGMPGAVVRSDLSPHILTLPDIGKLINDLGQRVA